MGLHRAWCSGWLRAAVAVGLLGLLVPCRARQRRPKRQEKAARTRSRPRGPGRSLPQLPGPHRSFAIARPTTSSRGWRPCSGRFPRTGAGRCRARSSATSSATSITSPWPRWTRAGICGIKTAGGVTLMRHGHGRETLPGQVGRLRQRPAGSRPARGGPCLLPSDLRPHRPGLVLRGDGGNGPLLEGGRLRGPRRAARDRVSPREPAEIARRDPFARSQVSGDSWQNYASRWALCHFLVHDPNYSPQFLSLGRGILAGKDISFDQTYGATARELWFEYLLFLQHIDRGYRVDLCAWDWNKKFACLRPGRTLTATIRAGRGWQPTGLTVSPGDAVRIRRHGQLADRGRAQGRRCQWR